MRHFYGRAIVAAMLMTLSAGAIAAPAKPDKPTKPVTPPKPTPPPAQPDTGPTTGDIIMCVATGGSIQTCMIGDTTATG